MLGPSLSSSGGGAEAFTMSIPTKVLVVVPTRLEHLKKKGKDISSSFRFMAAVVLGKIARSKKPMFLPSSASPTGHTLAATCTANFSVKDLSYAKASTIVARYLSHDFPDMVIPFLLHTARD
ncbi:hypothetical protein L6452_42073 [Arctium lappa]|uniref:Uncharacterized protein n=1 Tax=Arctium lappa TaxID=4217 RepID=A0ACB8XH73_ARCLA|nr:hypothetical protein L6452_42073 [Arctium lappa]